MKWITREKVKVDRVACPWLIRKFVDSRAEFLFVAADQVAEIAKREDAIPYDVKDAELGHHGKECSFDAIVKKYDLGKDPALLLLARIVYDALYAYCQEMVRQGRLQGAVCSSIFSGPGGRG